MARRVVLLTLSCLTYFYAAPVPETTNLTFITNKVYSIALASGNSVATGIHSGASGHNVQVGTSVVGSIPGLNTGVQPSYTSSVQSTSGSKYTGRNPFAGTVSSGASNSAAGSSSTSTGVKNPFAGLGSQSVTLKNPFATGNPPSGKNPFTGRDW